MRDVEVNSELGETILDIYYDNSLSDKWKEEAPYYEVDIFACVSIEVDPEDAKTIDEIKSFKVTHDVSGIKTFICKRK